MQSSTYVHQTSLFAPAESEILAEYAALEARIPFVEAPEYADLVNFNRNGQLPVHGWYYFKEGFSSQLVLDLLSRYRARQSGLVLDPFAGSGTTPLTCQMAGVPSVGVEFNPFFTFVARAKLNWWQYSPERLRPVVEELLRYDGPADHLPALSTFERIYDEPARVDLMRAKRFIRTVPLAVETDRDFLKLGLAAIVEKVSPARKDGKGLKIRRNCRVVPVKEALRTQFERMLADLVSLGADRRPGDAAVASAQMLQGDARRLTEVADDSIDFAVYSPPYLNSFDYSEVYKVELWLFDHIRDAHEFRSYRAKSLRSHVSTPVDWTYRLRHPVIDHICWHVAGQPLWNRHIPAMINGYFDDMYLVLKEQFRACRPGARVACVVGNSSYASLPVPTDALLAVIAEQVGFRLVEVLVARHLGTSSQQLASYDRRLRARYLRESVVVLEKPG